jgi:superoxide dismutase, Fe-Mn family
MFELPKLPYAEDALAPHISSETLRTHYGKHHAGYVKKTNELALKAELADRPLEQVIREARAYDDEALFNQAAQAWNHAFYWESMAPKAGAPLASLEGAIKKSFGSTAALRTTFLDKGEKHFGSGWIWLVRGHAGALRLETTHDGDTYADSNERPLLTCDLWEHAYYLDRKNERRAYLEAWFDQIANWEFAEKQWRADHKQAWLYPAPVLKAA